MAHKFQEWRDDGCNRLRGTQLRGTGELRRQRSSGRTACATTRRNSPSRRLPCRTGGSNSPNQGHKMNFTRLIVWIDSGHPMAPIISPPLDGITNPTQRIRRCSRLHLVKPALRHGLLQVPPFPGVDAKVAPRTNSFFAGTFKASGSLCHDDGFKMAEFRVCIQPIYNCSIGVETLRNIGWVNVV
jgi:hypothetical protein